MRLAVLKYRFINGAPAGIPAEWPAEVVEIGDQDPAPGENWVIMTQEEFRLHKESYQDEYDTWEATYHSTGEVGAQKQMQTDIEFGTEMMNRFNVESVVLGIVEARKESEVVAVIHNLCHYLRDGFLAASSLEISRIIDAGIDPALSPFITADRLNRYKSEIDSFIALD